jgi:excisionase family DNA binding protein
MKPATVPPRLMTDAEAAYYIGASKSYVRALIERGVLRPVELPTTDGKAGRARLLRLDKNDIDKWLDSLPRL